MIKSFTVGVKHHVNLGNYESMEIEAQVSMEDIEDFDTVRDDAQKVLSTLLNDTFNQQKKPAWFAQIPSKKRAAVAG